MRKAYQINSSVLQYKNVEFVLLHTKSSNICNISKPLSFSDIVKTTWQPTCHGPYVMARMASSWWTCTLSVSGRGTWLTWGRSWAWNHHPRSPTRDEGSLEPTPEEPYRGWGQPDTSWDMFCYKTWIAFNKYYVDCMI